MATKKIKTTAYIIRAEDILGTEFEGTKFLNKTTPDTQIDEDLLSEGYEPALGGFAEIPDISRPGGK